MQVVAGGEVNESATTTASQREPLARLATATAVGTAAEYYDFYLYTSVAALIFGPLFFPKLSPRGRYSRHHRHGRGRVRRPPGRRGDLRALRRPVRAQGHAGRVHGGDGHSDGPGGAGAQLWVFRELAARQQTVRVPVRELLRHHTGALLLAAAPAALGFTMLYLVTTYGLAYGTTQLHLPPTTMIYLVMLCYGLVMAALPAMGAASDRWGRRRVCRAACALAAAWALPFVWLVTSAEPILIAVAFIVALAIGIPQLVTMGAYLPELFGTRVRYTGTALSFNLASLVGTGLVRSPPPRYPLVPAPRGESPRWCW